MSDWRPIAEAPKEGTFLVYLNGPICGRIHVMTRMKAYNGVMNIICGHSLREFDEQPTHWQPLPAPPAPSQKLTDLESVSNCLSDKPTQEMLP